MINYTFQNMPVKMGELGVLLWRTLALGNLPLLHPPTPPSFTPLLQAI
jgi:hypothetical protein